jgi:hypothetical protein
VKKVKTIVTIAAGKLNGDWYIIIGLAFKALENLEDMSPIVYNSLFHNKKK